MGQVLTIRNLRISYPHKHAPVIPVLRDLDFDLDWSEVVGIFGASGSGKTTLARAIMRMLPASAQMHGQIELGETNLLELPEQAMQRIRGVQVGLIPQEPSVALNPFQTAGKQVEEVLRAHRKLQGRALRDEAAALLHPFFAADTDRVAGSYPHQLSGGERQRVAICQSIACGPSLLVADEPASAMDSIALKAFLDLLGELRRGSRISMILISHNLPALRYVADRCLQLKEGQLQA